MTTTIRFNFHRAIRLAGIRFGFRTGVLVALLAGLCLFGGLLSAQSTGSGIITGTVTDQSGAVVVGASVTVTNVATNVAYASVTNGTGYFEVDALNPGTYKVLTVAPGFEKLIRTGITLDAQARLAVTMKLKTGTVNEFITVVADASLLNTESGSNGQVLTTKQMEDLPAAGQNPAWYVLLAPGIQTSYSQTGYTQGSLGWNGVSHFAANGVWFANEFSLDGAPNMDARQNAVNPTEDELGEMKMDISGFDASVGKTMGASITQTTKSGTNVLHGTMRMNYLDERWSAMNHFQGLNYKHELAINGCTNGANTNAACKQIENLYGWPGTHENNGAFGVGGPVYIPKIFDGRNKLFFFVSWTDDVNGGAKYETSEVPTAQELNGNFNDLPATTANIPATYVSTCGTGTPYYGQYQIYDPFSVQLDANGVPRRQPICGNILPNSRISNNAMNQLYAKLVPHPNLGGSAGNNYAWESAEDQKYSDYTTREDYAISPKDHVFVRYTKTSYFNTWTGFTVGDVDDQYGPRWIHTGAIGWNHMFSAKMNLNVTAGGTNYQTECCYYPGYEANKPSDLGLPSYTDAYTAARPSLPVISISGASGIGQSNSPSQWDRVAAIRANVVRVQGRHTISAGSEFRLQNYAEGVSGNLNGTYNFDSTYTRENNGSDSTYPSSGTGLGYAAFVMGVQTSNSVSYTTDRSANSPYYALYVGDTWRVTPKLTIVPGLRYEYEFGVSEKHNKAIVGWDFNAAQPIATEVNAAYQASLAAATPTQKAVLPSSLTIQGGPMYAGVNGYPHRQFQNNLRVMPRIAVAYKINDTNVIRAGYGLFFDTMNAQTTSLDQDGFSASTSDSSSTTYGTNFVAGTSPLADPFPANASGARFNAPIGSAAGIMYYLGSSATVWDHNMVPARQQRVTLGWQHQFGSSTMMEIQVIDALTTHVAIAKSQSYYPASFYAGGTQPNSAENSLMSTQIINPFALANFSNIAGSNPAEYNLMTHNSFFTQSRMNINNVAHLYPQGGLSIEEPLGEVNYKQLQLNVNRRYSHGLTLMGALAFTQDHDRDYFANSFDPLPSWEATSNNSAPVRFTSEAIWKLPFGRGEAWGNGGWTSKAFGGFQLSTSSEMQTGELITFGNLFYVGEIKASNIKIKHPVFVNNLATGGSAYIQWLNVGNAVATASTTTSAEGITTTTCTYTGTGFVTNPSCQPNGYNLRAFPTRLKGVRQMGWDNWNANMQRDFPIKEGVAFQARFEAYNVFNHQCFSSPNVSPTSTQFGWVTAPAGENARWLAISGRIRF